MFISNVEVLLLLVYFFDPIVLETPLIFWLRNQSRVSVVCQSIFCVVCRDMFLSNDAVILIVVYLFDPVVL